MSADYRQVASLPFAAGGLVFSVLSIATARARSRAAARNTAAWAGYFESLEIAEAECRVAKAEAEAAATAAEWRADQARQRYRGE